MSSGGVPCLLITANVGSIFEEPSVMLKLWMEEFLSTVARLDPKFIALHCQEVGGKNYAESMRHVEDFVRLLMESEELRLFDKVRVFLDEDFSSAEHFTALGNLYFAHETLTEVLLWDFKDGNFAPVIGHEVYSGNIEAVTTKEKAKFPQDFFPECKWSRKGFLRTRWSVSGTVFDLINIHLFHDASNFIAMETFPSVYSKTRRRALEHTLDRFHNDHYPNAPYFLFGDFNFRTDTAGVIKKLTEDTRESKQSNKGSLSKLQFRNDSDDLILSLGKKEFSHHEHQQVFVENSGQWLREYDKELGDFEGRLFEFPISFVPSYPFEEDVKEGSNYMHTRVPAWCDRVLLSPSAKSLVKDISSPDTVEYGIIGPRTCMGDHKPVYLKIQLASDAGMVSCCGSGDASLCFRVPESYELERPDALAALSLAALPTSKLLHAAPLVHDPYTPDSMDSPSPNAHPAASFPPSLLRSPSAAKPADRAVSPQLLKSRLELIADGRRAAAACNSTSNSDTEEDWAPRKSRSNSDVSWQRSHLLTEAWLEGNGRQAYHSFSSELHAGGARRGPAHIVIPRIAIIHASNFESDASSVHLREGAPPRRPSSRHSDQQLELLAAYSNARTRSLSEADSSQAMSALALPEDEPPAAPPRRPPEDEARPEPRHAPASNATRSNSIRSQEANVSLKLKAYNKVTERCKRNIARKNKCCDRCCVVS
ncbi:inositol polyphosphate-5-phosphatase A [Phymastichus coffea]|uniref:inositol polyphosphate-5-phosphatase A n=1 Tax=Phymastichus coffea TaxID=108790 RepID=UPI00273AE783|nr:inositol polyphosphate-5-phosphatase A [Phymastichus coffea]XP_058798037.1 inositol polyphosphate-5-phosphatase A [Phymastichus coffea]XP_058798038.1 inositol polyphosphate-5-phosphatase A [Phymastichus coffea]XP_058798039.1 inositol polyphosphate-5-phosphatase A [Phymastichus coffea]